MIAARSSPATWIIRFVLLTACKLRVKTSRWPLAWPQIRRRDMQSLRAMPDRRTRPNTFDERLSVSLWLETGFLFNQAFPEHRSDLPPARLKEINKKNWRNKDNWMGASFFDSVLMLFVKNYRNWSVSVEAIACPKVGAFWDTV